MFPSIKQVFTKSFLKSGMIVETKVGFYRVFRKDDDDLVFALIDKTSDAEDIIYDDDFTDDLINIGFPTRKKSEQYDIISVAVPKNDEAYNIDTLNDYYFDVCKRVIKPIQHVFSGDIVTTRNNKKWIIIKGANTYHGSGFLLCLNSKEELPIALSDYDENLVIKNDVYDLFENSDEPWNYDIINVEATLNFEETFNVTRKNIKTRKDK